jgi:phosphomannomutase
MEMTVECGHGAACEVSQALLEEAGRMINLVK